MSKEKGSCNNITVGTKSSQNGSHMIAIIQNFTLASLTSNAMLHLVKLLFEVVVLSYPMYLTPYALNSSLSMQLERISGCDIYLYFVHLSKNEVYYPCISLDDKK